MNAYVNPKIATDSVISIDRSIAGWRWLNHFGNREAFWLEPYVREDGEPCVAAHLDRETAWNGHSAELFFTVAEFRQVDLGRAHMFVG